MGKFWEQQQKTIKNIREGQKFFESRSSRILGKFFFFSFFPNQFRLISFDANVAQHTSNPMSLSRSEITPVLHSTHSFPISWSQPHLNCRAAAALAFLALPSAEPNENNNSHFLALTFSRGLSYKTLPICNLQAFIVILACHYSVLDRCD